MKRTRSKDIKTAAQRAGAQIQTINDTGRHIKITLSNGAIVYAGLTPSDRRSNLNLICDLRRAARS